MNFKERYNQLNIKQKKAVDTIDGPLLVVAVWLAPGGQLFVHIFAHRTLTYHFEDHGDDDWMTRYFFSGGTMTSESLLLHFQDHLRILDQWWVDGRHYERTSNHWLDGLDAARAQCLEVLAKGYGAGEATVWLQRWRMFYMAVAELFGYDQGREWVYWYDRSGKRYLTSQERTNLERQARIEAEALLQKYRDRFGDISE